MQLRSPGLLADILTVRSCCEGASAASRGFFLRLVETVIGFEHYSERKLALQSWLSGTEGLLINLATAGEEAFPFSGTGCASAVEGLRRPSYP
jgi:hypothetical protein